MVIGRNCEEHWMHFPMMDEVVSRGNALKSMFFYIRSALEHSISGIRHVSRTKEMAVTKSLSDPFLLNDIGPEM
jgi:hypothetical protein